MNEHEKFIKEQDEKIKHFMLPFWQWHSEKTNDEIFEIARGALFTGGCTPLSHPRYRTILDDFDKGKQYKKENG